MTETQIDPARRRSARGAVTAPERALAPDLARGFMLLLIVLSNTAFHLWAARHGATGWHPVDGSALDGAVQFAMIVMLDGRSYPLFAFLLGYGMMQLFQRQIAAGATDLQATALLRRRSLWLVVFGFFHAALLLAGDIVSFYGVVTLILGWLFLRRANRTLLIAAAVAVLFSWLLEADVLAAIVRGDLAGAGDPTTEPILSLYASGEANPLAAAGTRLTTWSIIVIFGAVGWLCTPEILFGFWAARHRLLEDPAQHLRLLRRVALIGVPIGWLGALPLALAHAGWWDVPAAAIGEGGVVSTVAWLTGVPGGLGYVALFGLLAYRLQARGRQRHPVVVAVSAVGKRSLSAYLTHSLLFAPVLAAWGLGLGAHLGSATMALFAIGVWLITVAAAYTLERLGRTGPAEALLRRLVYGPASRPRRVRRRDEPGEPGQPVTAVNAGR